MTIRKCALQWRRLFRPSDMVHSLSISAETFLACVSTCQAKCLLVDIELGDLSGVELARQLAADGFKFPVIFMSGYDDAMVEIQAIAAGGIAFLHKPFPAEMLLDAIKMAVEADWCACAKK